MKIHPQPTNIVTTITGVKIVIISPLDHHQPRQEVLPLSHLIITSSKDNKPFTNATQATISTVASSTQLNTQTSTIKRKNTTLSSLIPPPCRQTFSNLTTSQAPHQGTPTTKAATIHRPNLATRAVAVHPTTAPHKLSRTPYPQTIQTSTTTSRISHLTPSQNNNSTKMSMHIIHGSNSNLLRRLRIRMSRAVTGIALEGVAARVVAAEATEAAVETAGEAPATTNTITTIATEAVSCYSSSSKLAVALSSIRHRSR